MNKCLINGDYKLIETIGNFPKDILIEKIDYDVQKTPNIIIEGDCLLNNYNYDIDVSFDIDVYDLNFKKEYTIKCVEFKNIGINAKLIIGGIE